VDTDEQGQVEPAGRGRPSKYRPEFSEQARKLCELGATDPQLADFFQVSLSTVSLWKTVHRDFSEALKAGKEIADEMVERSLYQRAIGYTHDEDDIRAVSVGGNAGSEIVITQTRKHYPPDAVAAIFWLKNRRPDRWRDIKAVELTGSNGEPLLIRITGDDAKL
jgi:hypothetical protein